MSKLSTSDLSFFGDPALKQRLLDRIAAHEQADSIMQGPYWEHNGEQWRGCAIGCSLMDLANPEASTPLNPPDWHRTMERELGIPARLTLLEDDIFEQLPTDQALRWPRRFSEAIPVGVDLGPVLDRINRRRILEELIPLTGPLSEDEWFLLRGPLDDAVAAMESSDPGAIDVAIAQLRRLPADGLVTWQGAPGKIVESAVEALQGDATWSFEVAQQAVCRVRGSAPVHREDCVLREADRIIEELTLIPLTVQEVG